MEASESVEQLALRQRRESLTATVLKVVWLAIGLALAVELILVVLAVAFRQETSTTGFVSELAEKITWSIPACVALVIGKLASRSRPPVMGFAGLLVTPAAFQVATVVQQTVTATLGGAVSGSVGLIVILTPVVKGIEYGALGVGLAYVARQKRGASAHLLLGVIIGLLAGAVLVGALLSTGATNSAADLIGTVLEETLMACGCAVIVYVTTTLLGLQADLT